MPFIDDPRVRFFPGWFEDTLPVYEWPEHEVLVAMFDADLYSSTVAALAAVRPHLRSGSLVYFDQFHHRADELRAFAELIDEMMPATAVAGRSVTTVEGLERGDLHPVQKAFIAHDAMQCGFCTPGLSWRRPRSMTTGARRRRAKCRRATRSLTHCRVICAAVALTSTSSGRRRGLRGQVRRPAAPGPRMEAADKVTGRAKYTVDIAHEGRLEGRILRSIHAHAKLPRSTLSRRCGCPA